MSLTYAIYLRILNLCNERNISINKLCEMSGISQSSMSNYASDRTYNASCVPIYKVCRYLDISLSDFFNDSIFSKINNNLYE